MLTDADRAALDIESRTWRYTALRGECDPHPGHHADAALPARMAPAR